MHPRPRATLTIIALVLTPQGLPAQTGTADLRYRAPLPASITYVTLDSISTTMSMPALPAGEMTGSTIVRSVNELTFGAAEGGFDVTAVLEELRGTAMSPMGEMPISAEDVPPVTFRMTERGPDPEDVGANMAPPPIGASAGDMMGWSKAASGLLTLPGRELVLGESWSDTVRMSPEVEGLKTETVTVTHGTYSADTVVDGRPLNVLEIRSEATMKMNGTVRGMNMTHHTTVSTNERVLWDSARHYLLSRDAVGTISTEMSVPDQGVTMTSSGRTRTITTAQPES